MRLKNEIPGKKSFTTYLKFVISSLSGIFIFLIPVRFEEKITIPIGALVDVVKAATSQFLPLFCTAIIATSFSIVSIAFCLVVAQFGGVDHMFPQFYLTVIVSGLVAAFVMSRIPPLPLKKNTYYDPVGKQIHEEVPRGKSLFLLPL
jgi:nucleoside recognition membrane protein YjiH